MKRIFVVLAIIVGFSSVAVAQRGTDTRPSQSKEYQQKAPGGGERLLPEEIVAKQMERLIKRLELTGDQQVKIRALLEAQMTEMKANMKAMREKMDEDPEAAKAQMEANKDAIKAKMEATRKKNAEQIRALLTEEQKITYDEMQEEMKQRIHNAGRPSVNHADE